jgi:hypothetical protein
MESVCVRKLRQTDSQIKPRLNNAGIKHFSFAPILLMQSDQSKLIP